MSTLTATCTSPGERRTSSYLARERTSSPRSWEHFYQSNCPYIKEICVLGIRDETSSEEREKLHAVIVPDFDYMKTQQTINAQDMLRYLLETLSKRLPSYKRVGSFEVRQEPLPRTNHSQDQNDFKLARNCKKRPMRIARLDSTNPVLLRHRRKPASSR